MKGTAVAGFNHPFEDFLSAWNRHQSLRQSGADFESLVDSRMHLEVLRLDAIRSLR